MIKIQVKTMMGNARDKIFSGLIGCAVGDALGAPFEGMNGDNNRTIEMSGGGQFNLKKGEVTDDTLMMIALGETYCETGKFDREVFLKKVILTVREDNRTFGKTTKTVVSLLEQGCSPEEVVSAVHKIFGSGTNGSVMRTLPIGLVPISEREKIARDVSAFTHYDKVAGECCAIISNAAAGLLAGKAKADVLSEIPPEYFRGKLVPSIDAMETTRCALVCFRDGNNYEEVIHHACILGGDTDTIGCVAGGLAGILWEVPKKWVDQLLIKDKIRNLADKLKKVTEE
jgi:ADP-ribosyl-[dinitrogen reductase] hydrolase